MFSIAQIAPSLVSMFDDGKDVVFFIDMNEEEDNQGKEAAKDLEIKIYSTEQFDSLLINGIQKKKNVRFRSKTYTSLFRKNSTPPPKFLS